MQGILNAALSRFQYQGFVYYSVSGKNQGNVSVTGTTTLSNGQTKTVVGVIEIRTSSSMSPIGHA